MTVKLTRGAGTVDSKFPDVCPKCGAAFGPRTTLLAIVRQHFERAHPKAIGTAHHKDGPELFDFGYVAPVTGTTMRRWWIVAFSWPYALVSITTDEWKIEWRVGTGPTEGVNG